MSEAIQEHAEKVQDLLAEIRDLGQMPVLPVYEWYLHLPKRRDPSIDMDMIFVPKVPPAPGVALTPVQVGNKWLPEGNWYPMPSFYRWLAKVQIDGFNAQIARIDVKHQGEIQKYATEIREIDTEIAKIKSQHSEKEMFNHGLQEQIEELDEKMQNYLENENGSEYDLQYKAYAQERDALIAKKQGISADPDYKVFWRTAPGSATGAVQDITILKRTYETKKASLESIRDREKEEFVDKRATAKKHWEKYNELVALTMP